MSTGERTALATASLVSNSIIVDGVTVGDVEAGLSYQTRHSRTISILFRSRLAAAATAESDETIPRQTLIFAIRSSSSDDESGIDLESRAMKGLQHTFDAIVVESGLRKKLSLGDLYDVKVISVSNSGEAKEVSINLLVSFCQLNDL
jgi:hypothetical protein